MVSLFQDRLTRELSRFELGLLVIVVLLAALLLMNRGEAVFASIERTRMQTTVLRLQTALQLETAARIMRGTERLLELNGANPFDLGERDTLSVEGHDRLFSANLGGYLGALKQPDLAALPSGRWFFNQDNGTLVYLVEHTDHFRTSLPGPARARFRVEVEFEDQDGNGVYDRGEEPLGAARLRRLDDFDWL